MSKDTKVNHVTSSPDEIGDTNLVHRLCPEIFEDTKSCIHTVDCKQYFYYSLCKICVHRLVEAEERQRQQKIQYRQSHLYPEEPAKECMKQGKTKLDIKPYLAHVYKFPGDIDVNQFYEHKGNYND